MITAESAEDKRESAEMNDIEPEINVLSDLVIGAAIEVHRELGPGLLKSIYEQALHRELTIRGVPHERQVGLAVHYKGEPLEGNLRLDLVVSNTIVLELKAVDILLPIHTAQLLSYLKLTGMPLGLLINFHSNPEARHQTPSQHKTPALSFAFLRALSFPLRASAVHL